MIFRLDEIDFLLHFIVEWLMIHTSIVYIFILGSSTAVIEMIYDDVPRPSADTYT